MKILNTYNQKQKRILLSIFVIYEILILILTLNGWPSRYDEEQFAAWFGLNILFWLIITLFNWIRQADSKS